MAVVKVIGQQSIHYQHLHISASHAHHSSSSPKLWPWHLEDKISLGLGKLLIAFERFGERCQQNKGMKKKLTLLPEPATPGGLPYGTPGHTAVEAHVRLL